jgi:transglutaminase-like putative cysteine protease
VEVSQCKASSPLDTFESLVGAGVEVELNKVTRAALAAASLFASADLTLLVAYLLGEPHLLKLATPQQMPKLLQAAAAFGYTEALLELTHRIHEDFQFDATATTVSTSVDEVMQLRRGVCQDFAHLMLACLRAHGLAARYMSGYLLTDPPPGMPRLMGVDASHAWVAAFLPGHGWVEFDPTNDQLADRRYITLAWGADFADVAPLRGVILGGGFMQDMQVEVSVIPHD